MQIDSSLKQFSCSFKYFFSAGRKCPASRCLPSLCALGILAEHWMRMQPPLSHRGPWNLMLGSSSQSPCPSVLGLAEGKRLNWFWNQNWEPWHPALGAHREFDILSLVGTPLDLLHMRARLCTGLAREQRVLNNLLALTSPSRSWFKKQWVGCGGS